MRLPILPLRSFFSHALDLVLPVRPSQRTVRELTDEDLASLPPTDSGALPYRDTMVRALLWEVKYYASAHALMLCAPNLSERLLEIASEELGVALLIPIPMHRTRKKERGHNQTELLCEAALQSMGNEGAQALEYVPDVLERRVHTKPQQTLPKHLRRTNVKGSMHVREPQRVRGRACIVLDDVSTTGATFAEASRALCAAGARAVYFVALAQS
jgi:ComF family protein